MYNHVLLFRWSKEWLYIPSTLGVKIQVNTCYKSYAYIIFLRYKNMD